jgi:DNA-directed RNA polymerase specialized sigma24 family protein
MADSRIAYKEDYEFAQLLLEGESKAWDRFYKEFRKKLEAYINRKYPNVFSEIVIEEIFDGVGKRLIENDYRALRDYRGECSFSTYITKATEWEIKDWLRKHSEELMNEPLDTIGTDNKAFNDIEETYDHSFQEDIPEPIKSLSDDLRFAFLLRYYDYFGFPFNEIRRLAKNKGVSIGDITRKIIRYLEPEGEDILRMQREKQKTFHSRLERICCRIHELNVKEQKLLINEDYEKNTVHKLEDIRNRRSKLEEKRQALLKNKTKLMVTTPYEVIAEILGEDNVSTIRSRVFLAKKQLAQKLAVKDG